MRTVSLFGNLPALEVSQKSRANSRPLHEAMRTWPRNPLRVESSTGLNHRMSVGLKNLRRGLPKEMEQSCGQLHKAEDSCGETSRAAIHDELSMPPRKKKKNAVLIALAQERTPDCDTTANRTARNKNRQSIMDNRAG